MSGAIAPLPFQKDVDERIVSVCDFRELLDNLTEGSVDLILTDPPYAISRKTGFSKVKNGVKRFAVTMDFGPWDHAEIDLNRLANACYRTLRKGGTAIIWYDLWKISRLAEAMTDAGFRMLRLVLWEKTNPVPLNMRATYLSNSREVAVSGVKQGKATFNQSYHRGVYHYPIPRHQGNRIHPTQKPLNLFSELVKVHSNPGDLVVDPFLGSGTTAVAALMQGRKFRGGRSRPSLCSRRTQEAGACLERGQWLRFSLSWRNPMPTGFRARCLSRNLLASTKNCVWGMGVHGAGMMVHWPGNSTSNVT